MSGETTVILGERTFEEISQNRTALLEPGEVVAHQIAARLKGTAPEASFGGVGYCYLETGGGRAVKADGSFFALPHPVMRKQSPDEAQMRDKLDWVARQLRPRT